MFLLGTCVWRSKAGVRSPYPYSLRRDLNPTQSLLVWLLSLAGMLWDSLCLYHLKLELWTSHHAYLAFLWF